MLSLHYYWKRLITREDGLLNTAKLNFEEINSGSLAILKRIGPWAVCIHRPIEPIYLGLSALVWRVRDTKAEAKALRL